MRDRCILITVRRNRTVELIHMKEKPEQRAVTLGMYIAENHATVRNAAQHFGISKSTVHKDVSDRLRKEDPALYEKGEEDGGVCTVRDG